MQTKKKSKLEKTNSEKLFLKKLGQKIVEQAGKKQTSIERLAFESDVSKSYMYGIVKGEANPSLVILLRIASCLDVSVQKILPV